MNNFDDLLPFFYSDFRKDFIASLTAKLAASNYIIDINNTRQLLSKLFVLFKVADNRIIIKRIFEDSGYELARHIIAIQPKIDKVFEFFIIKVFFTKFLTRSNNIRESYKNRRKIVETFSLLIKLKFLIRI